MTTVQATTLEHSAGSADFMARLNWLRAAVLGAGDGIVSVAGLVMGVAGATADRWAVMIAGVAGVIAGALSMAAGEYVSVSTQRDGEQSLLGRKAEALRADPAGQLQVLAHHYRRLGLSPELAHEVAVQLSDRDALRAHAEVELGVDPDGLTNPWHAAWASMASFTAGALVPLAAILLSPHQARVPVTVVAVLVALAITGSVSARLGAASVTRASVRNLLGGALAMAITYAVGSAVGGL